MTKLDIRLIVVTTDRNSALLSTNFALLITQRIHVFVFTETNCDMKLMVHYMIQGVHTILR